MIYIKEPNRFRSDSLLDINDTAKQPLFYSAAIPVAASGTPEVVPIR